MSLPNFQKNVAAFVAVHQLEASVENRLLDLVSEVGELAKEVLKGGDYGSQPIQLSPAWADELGDVLFSLTCLANSTGINMEYALQQAMQKYGNRLEEKREAGSGR